MFKVWSLIEDPSYNTALYVCVFGCSYEHIQLMDIVEKISLRCSKCGSIVHLVVHSCISLVATLHAKFSRKTSFNWIQLDLYNITV